MGTFDNEPVNFRIGVDSTGELTGNVLVDEIMVECDTGGGGGGAVTACEQFCEAIDPPDITLLTESFEDTTFPPVGWSMYDLDGDAYNWYRTSAWGSHDGSYIARHSFLGSGDQNSWLVSPLISLGDAPVLTFWDYEWYSGDYAYNAIYVSGDSCDPGDGEFIEIMELGPRSSAWREVVVDLAAYANSDICFAFMYAGDFADANGDYE